MNENPNPQPYVQKIARPPDGAASRIHQPKFPILSHEFVQKIIDDEQTKSSLKSRSVLTAIVNFVQSCKLTNNFISPSRPPSLYANVGRVFHAHRFALSKIALVT
jgi:hypothetical protein